MRNFLYLQNVVKCELERKKQDLVKTEELNCAEDFLLKVQDKQNDL